MSVPSGRFLEASDNLTAPILKLACSPLQVVTTTKVVGKLPLPTIGLQNAGTTPKVAFHLSVRYIAQLLLRIVDGSLSSLE
jgi:hypothetical protein